MKRDISNKAHRHDSVKHNQKHSQSSERFSFTQKTRHRHLVKSEMRNQKRYNYKRTAVIIIIIIIIIRRSEKPSSNTISQWSVCGFVWTVAMVTTHYNVRRSGHNHRHTTLYIYAFSNFPENELAALFAHALLQLMIVMFYGSRSCFMFCPHQWWSAVTLTRP